MSLVFRETSSLMRTILNDKPTVWTGYALLLLVALIVMAYSAARFFEDTSRTAMLVAQALDLEKDKSVAEIVGYGFSFLAAVLFFLVGIERRSRVVMFLFLLMMFVWLDDVVRYHERFGQWLIGTLSLPAIGGLRAQDVGELLAWAIAGTVLLGVLLLALMRRKPGDLGILGMVFSCFLLLILCGVLFDMLHVLAPIDLETGFGVVEDGGEMMALALIAVIAIGVARVGAECQNITTQG